MKILAIFLISLGIFASGAVLNEITKLSDIFGAGVTKLSEDVTELNVKLFCTEIELWMKLGYQTNLLKRMIKVLSLPDSFRQSRWRSIGTGVSGTAKCIVCRAIATSVIKFRRTGVSEKSIITAIEHLCWQLNIASKSVCEGVVRLHVPIIFYIIDQKPSLTARDFCGLVMQSENCATPSSEFDWTVEVDSGPSRHISYRRTNETINIVQLSDIHFDPKYEPNGNPHCDDPICCRVGQNVTNVSGQLAGFWGDYNNCDTPWHSVIDAFNHINSHHQDHDYIYFTGDIIDHGIWETSAEMNKKSMDKIYNKMKLEFPSSTIYPILGNHEPHPLNLFAPSSITDENLNTTWLYEYVAEKWISFGWLPESTRSTILQGGFYTVSPKRGFRIIALNNNVCYTFNWWLLYSPNDPNGQLKWLADTLLKAERKGEFVHILAHLPAGSHECLRSWSREYRKIVNRFAHIIAAEFNGHTHNDEIRVFYRLENRDDAIGVGWNGGSITAYTKRNPNYRVYTANNNNYRVEDAMTWIYNLTHANLSPREEPEWFLSYSFREANGLADLSLKSLDDWLKRLTHNQSIALQYYSNYVTLADPDTKTKCDTKCIKDIVCEIVTTDTSDHQDCDRFSKLMTDKLLGDPRFFNFKVSKLPGGLKSFLPKFLTV